MQVDAPRYGVVVLVGAEVPFVADHRIDASRDVEGRGRADIEEVVGSACKAIGLVTWLFWTKRCERMGLGRSLVSEEARTEETASALFWVQRR